MGRGTVCGGRVDQGRGDHGREIFRQGRYSEGQGDSDGIWEDEGKGHAWRLADGPGGGIPKG